MTNSHGLFLCALLLYFLSAGLYHVRVLVKGVRSGWLAHAAALAGFALHTIAIIDRSIILGHAPYFELREALATIAWAIVLLTLLVEWRRKTYALGALAMPMAVVIMFLADTLPSQSKGIPLVPMLRNNPLEAHIGAIVTAFGGFALAFCAALMYLVQERRLKEKRMPAKEPGMLSLVEIEQMANSLAAFSFSMLTLGLLLGVLWAASGAWTGRWYDEPIVFATVATWAVYAAYLYMRSVRGERGRTNMYLLIAGFTLAASTVLVVRLVFPGRHGF